MEVATALLEASRKMSGSGESGGSSCSATASWSSSASEMNDKTGDLPNSSAWLSSWGKRSRTQSESDSGSFMGAWLSGMPGMRERSNSQGQGQALPGAPWGQGQGLLGPGWGQPRVRRSSSKDVEEAMAGGLSKSEIFMPPM